MSDHTHSPGKVIVTPSGNVMGLANHARELLQGGRFWQDQLKVAKKELQDAFDEPARDAAFRREIHKMEQDSRQETEDFYRRYPDMRPSPAERKAQALRDAADRIEQAESDRFLEEERLKRIAELQAIIPVILDRGGTS